MYGDDYHIEKNENGQCVNVEPGMYRFCKTITDSYAPGDNDSITFYAEFEILD